MESDDILWKVMIRKNTLKASKVNAIVFILNQYKSKRDSYSIYHALNNNNELCLHLKTYLTEISFHYLLIENYTLKAKILNFL